MRLNMNSEPSKIAQMICVSLSTNGTQALAHGLRTSVIIQLHEEHWSRGTSARQILRLAYSS